MHNKRLLAKPVLIVAALLVIYSFIYPSVSEASEQEIDIATSPDQFLFKVGNLKPGDWMPREITISNEGKRDFNYYSFVEKKHSEKELFENLTLSVQDKNNHFLYKGKLADFKGFPPRFLKSGKSETLLFTVKMPDELGNEFQGSAAAALFKFYAEEPDSVVTPPPGDNNDPGTPPDQTGSNPGQPGSIPEQPQNADTKHTDHNQTGEKLPDTATDTYNILLAGVFLTLSGGTLLILQKRKKRERH
ncbi:LPXTG cell wall anchor domain-containing protein [Bacillus sp. OV322]|uniref:LPXTG cell wall anchor domain-containing protein n=1 Tax=Bacillus sp. OV322 TaxID=1882764 RepID=UPI000B80C0A3|nr:LPXTG cell wall anchor domain-containing protein [Bacillus sp. OV322]